MWTVVKIVAAASAAILVLLFIFLLVMVTRPAILVGVSDSALANSISGAVTSSDGGSCTKGPGDDWSCWVHGPDANGSFVVDVNWMGCWTAAPKRGRTDGEQLQGCIQLGDILTLEDLSGIGD